MDDTTRLEKRINRAVAQGAKLRATLGYPSPRVVEGASRGYIHAERRNALLLQVRGRKGSLVAVGDDVERLTEQLDALGVDLSDEEVAAYDAEVRARQIEAAEAHLKYREEYLVDRIREVAERLRREANDVERRADRMVEVRAEGRYSDTWVREVISGVGWMVGNLSLGGLADAEASLRKAEQELATLRAE